MRRLFILAAALALPACGGGGGDDPAPETRTFAMGFTPFPYARSLQAVSDTWAAIVRDGDLVVFHYDDGVPWQEAYDQTPYPTDYQNELTAAVAAAPPGHRRFLQITPMSFNRDGLAPFRTGSGTSPLTAPWNGYAFDDPHVITAYTRHCERMISIFNPDYVGFGIEVNLLAYFAPAKWTSFAALAHAVHDSLKASHPGTPFFMSLQADSFFGVAGQAAAIAQILPWTDFIAVSAYGYSQEADPAKLRPDFLSALAALAPGKPFAISETGWPGEDVTSPYPVTIPETPERQRQYVEHLLAECRTLNAVFINWFLVRDYDDLWTSELQFLSNASTTRVWRDIGLYQGDGTERPALSTWRATLALPRR